MWSFLGVTCHFLQGDQVREVALHFDQFDCRGTSDNLAKEWRKILRWYGITDKVAGVTVDNAPAVLNAVRDLGIELTGCATHVLNIAVKDGLQSLQKGLIEKGQKCLQSDPEPKGVQKSISFDARTPRSQSDPRCRHSLELNARYARPRNAASVVCPPDHINNA